VIPFVSRPIMTASSPSTLSVPTSRSGPDALVGPTTLRTDLCQAWMGSGWLLLVLLWAMPTSTRGSHGANCRVSAPETVTAVRIGGSARQSSTTAHPSPALIA
jgi:hypothetical protein